MPRYYARVATKSGEVVHLAEVSVKRRPFSVDDLKTLCGHLVEVSMDGMGDACDCLACLKIEKLRPLPRSSQEDPLNYVPTHRRPKTIWKRLLKD